MNEVSIASIFNYEGVNPVRHIDIYGKPWFVAKDVCDCLQIQNPTMALRNLEDDEKMLVKFSSLSLIEGVTNQSLNPGQVVNVINESGVYALVIQSRKPEAKKFRKWFTSEVIPSIRERGSYVHVVEADTPESIRRKAEEGAAFALKYYMEQCQLQQVQIEEQKVAIGIKQAVIEQQKPKVDAWELFMNSKTSFCTRDIAHPFGMSPQTLNKIMKELGWKWLNNIYLLDGEDPMVSV